jgi:hypothetical protein
MQHEGLMKLELPSSPLSIGGVLDCGVRLCRDSFSSCWLPALLAALAGMAYGIFEALVMPSQLTNLFATLQSLRQTGQALPPPPMMLSPGLLAGAFLMPLLVSVASIWCYGAMLFIGRALIQGDAASLLAGRPLIRSLGRLPAVVACGIVSVMAIMVGSVVSLLVIVMIGGGLAALAPALFTQGGGPIVLLLITLALVLYLLPAVYLAIKFQLAMAAMFLDDAGPIDALSISWRLTRGRWWRAFAIVSVSAVIVYLFAIVVSLLGVALATLIPASSEVRGVVAAVLGHLSSFVVYPAFMAVYIAMYHDFQLRSQGSDLAARVNALRQA